MDVPDLGSIGRERRRQLVRAQRASDLLVTKLPASPFTYVGIRGGGCVRLDDEELARLCETLEALREQQT
jgi:hypothetical protein